jgi:hypothetical protein
MDRNALPDDPSILPEDPLWRFVHPQNVVYDDTLKMLRLSSGTFSDSSNPVDPMSCVLAQVVIAGGRTPSQLLADKPAHGIAQFLAKDARSVGLRVARTPEPDEPAHASVIGKKTGRVQNALVRAARWVVHNPSTELMAHLARKQPAIYRLLEGRDISGLFHPQD